MKKNKKGFRRVDFQVAVFTAVIVIICSFSIFIFNYYITYKDMILDLEKRVESIYSYVEDKLDKSTFYDINSSKDENDKLYETNKKLLEDIKESSGVMYLYTAKKDQNGDFIYVLDGLSESAPDFRHPGDMIEKEIYPDMERALNNEKILPDKILKTDWGKIFITYFPIHDNGKVVGVLGIEIEAQHQYYTYQMLKIFTPLLSLICCIISIIFALIFFRRISNPLYSDMSNTDQLTLLKNRNAYDIDINNINVSGKYFNMGIIIMDLDNLKKVNDNLGHIKGDEYIKTVSEALKKTSDGKYISYRIGGDEFAVFMTLVEDKKARNFIEEFNENFELLKPIWDIEISVSAGYAVFDENKDNNLNDVIKRADMIMYNNKKTKRKEKTIAKC